MRPSFVYCSLIAVLAGVLLFSIPTASAQGLQYRPSPALTSTPAPQPAGVLLGAAALWSQRTGESDHSAFGFAVLLGYQTTSGLAPTLRMNYRSWKDPNYMPAYVGVQYRFALHPRFQLVPYLGLGPALTWGNDWAGIFAGYDAGLQLQTPISTRTALTLGLGYGRGMAFHPSEFGYLDVTLGLTFLR